MKQIPTIWTYEVKFINNLFKACSLFWNKNKISGLLQILNSFDKFIINNNNHKKKWLNNKCESLFSLNAGQTTNFALHLNVTYTGELAYDGPL